MSHLTKTNGLQNKLKPEDFLVHNWYRFVLSYPPHLVRHLLDKFQLKSGAVVLDPFCGTGTTLVECKRNSIKSIGIEANPMAAFASRVKVNWEIDPTDLLENCLAIADATRNDLALAGIFDESYPALSNGNFLREYLRTIPPESMKLLLKNSICPIPLHKTIVLLDNIEAQKGRYYDIQRLALAKALVNGVGNLHFGPEVGVGPAKRDAPVIKIWIDNIKVVVSDLRKVKNMPSIESAVFFGDSRDLIPELEFNSIDAIITSPPYPNEKDYTRTTRLESVLLGFLRDANDLRVLKKHLIRSNTRNVYKADDDDLIIKDNREIERIADEIERKRIELGKTSGFEKLYPRVTKLYFGGMMKHFSELRRALKPGAKLAYVVGDQASYLRVMIRTGQLLADLAQSLGYRVIELELFRTRLSTVTREQLREEILILEWPKV